MPRAQQFKAKLVNKQVLNEKFIHFRFELNEPDTIHFNAGQYIMFTVDNQRTKRSYSIANAPDDNNHVEVFLDVTPNGVGVNFLRDLKERDEVEFLGPVGRFAMDVEQKEKEIVLIGTGCGLAPLRSMLLDRLKDEQDHRPIKLYWGLRYPKQAAFQRELQTLDQVHDNFEYHLVLSRSEQGEPNCKHVTDCLTKDTVNPKAGFYLCGNNHMVKDVTEILTSLGVPEDSIHHEKFDLSC